jgi:hypothetical protein
MDQLATHIERTVKERGSCVVFEDELERCWPRQKIERMEREEQIQGFAKFHGWRVSILETDSGLTRAIFTRR